jgi:hypothetical protein
MIQQADRTTGSLVARFAVYVTDLDQGSPQSLSTDTIPISFSDPIETIINRTRSELQQAK